LAGLSATLLVLAFPPYDFWPLIFVGLVPMILAQHRVLPRRLSGLALGLGVGGFFWGYFGGMFAGGPWYMRWLPLIIGPVAALIGHGDRAFHERTRYRWFVLHGAAVWVGIEFIRGCLPAMGTWGFVGYALYEQAWLIQPVSIFGIYGLDLLIMVVNYALALGLLTALERRYPPLRGRIPVGPGLSRRWLLLSGALLGGWTVYSLMVLHTVRLGPTIRVAAIQPGFRIRSEEGLQRQFALTRQAAARGAQLIVWHEGALPFDPQEEHARALRALAADTDAYLAIGYAVPTDQGLRNEVAVLSPHGDFLGVYGKDHPVAFAGETSLTRGTYPAYETAIGRLGTIICYDLDFTDTARKVARNGAQIIAVPSFDWPAVAAKHYSHLVFRAVENRAGMVKADVAYDSAIIDPAGRILSRAVSNEPAGSLLIADLPLGTADAPAIRLGDWVGWLCLAAAGGLAGMSVLQAYPFGG
jgi:apolipoprotein N-acyltransferase